MRKLAAVAAIFLSGLAIAQNLPKFGKARFGHAVVGGLALLVLVCAGPAWSQVQLGMDIDAEASSDKSGYSVSLSSDGTRVAIGARANDGNGNDSGHVRVYEWDDTTSAWVQVGQDIDGEAANDSSGSSVSLSGDGTRVAIGAPYNSGNGTNSGHVRVFEWNSSAWTQVGSDIDGEAVGDQSGVTVSLSSDGARVAIGAPYNDDNGSTSGSVRVYDWNGTAWAQVGGDIDGEAINDASARAVSLSGNGVRVAIGASWNDAGGTSSGHVRVYELSGNNWMKLGADIDGEAASDNSGSSVSLSSDGMRVAIGAYGINSYSGHVRVYDWDNTNIVWAQVGGDIDGEASNDRSGSSVSLSGDGTRVAIGAPYNSGNGTNSGHVRVYELGGNNWTQLVSDINGEAASDLSGESVSLSSDGTRVAIGSIYNDGNGSNSGHARVYLNVSRPSAPSAPTATSGNGQATVTWSKPADGGSTITGYTVTSSPDGQTCSTNDADTLSCVVTSLTNGTAYRFTMTATNDVGTSTSSSASNSVTPELDSDGDGVSDDEDAFPNDPTRSASPAMPVPLMPAVVLFLLAGLLGLVGVRRFKL